MSQLNFYVPTEVEEQIREAAQKDGKPISSFLAELVKSHFPTHQGWPKGFFESLVGCVGSDFPDEIEDPPPRPVGDL
jgi:hypothetical protein